MTDVTPVAKGKKRRKPSTDKRVATELHSKIVRSDNCCDAGNSDHIHLFPMPCSGPIQCAHIIRRRYAATRTDLANGVPLCAGHHAYLDSHIFELIRFVDLTYGDGTYDRLQAKADAGIAATGLSPLMFWRGERERLTEIARQKGLIR